MPGPAQIGRRSIAENRGPGMPGPYNLTRRCSQPMIPQEYIQEVVRRNDIEEIIGQYVQLRRRGRTATGLCPFHNEKTPSFVVYPDTQSFYCFGCGAGGRRHHLCAQVSITSAMSRPSNSWPPAPECPCPRRTTANPAPASVCWKSTAAPRGISTRTSTPKRRRPPWPAATGKRSAACPTRPSAASAWAMRPTISSACCTI